MHDEKKNSRAVTDSGPFTTRGNLISTTNTKLKPFPMARAGGGVTLWGAEFFRTSEPICTLASDFSQAVMRKKVLRKQLSTIFFVLCFLIILLFVRICLRMVWVYRIPF
jgi:hypothetical protein